MAGLGNLSGSLTITASYSPASDDRVDITFQSAKLVGGTGTGTLRPWPGGKGEGTEGAIVVEGISGWTQLSQCAAILQQQGWTMPQLGTAMVALTQACLLELDACVECGHAFHAVGHVPGLLGVCCAACPPVHITALFNARLCMRPLPVALQQPEALEALFKQNYVLLLSIFNPEGWLDITYVDQELRVGRDDKGNIFVLERC